MVKGRIVQTALKPVIETIIEREFEDSSCGFRPQGGCKDALRAVEEQIEQGVPHVVDADMASYFDTIPQAALMGEIAERISDSGVLELMCISQHISLHAAMDDKFLPLITFHAISYGQCLQ